MAIKRVDFGTGTDTDSGDFVDEALVKLDDNSAVLDTEITNLDSSIGDIHTFVAGSDLAHKAHGVKNRGRQKFFSRWYKLNHNRLGRNGTV